MSARESRPAGRPPFGKRTERLKASVDPDTKELLAAKARLLGYRSLGEYTSKVLTDDARGIVDRTKVHGERVREGGEIGPVREDER